MGSFMSDHTSVWATLALTTALASSANAMDDGCIYETNKDSTVYINYTCALANGDGNCDSSGTGFIISETGHVLTNNHVVSPESAGVVTESEAVKVRVGGIFSAPITAEIIARDKGNDLALLKLPARANGEGWPTVAIANTQDLPVGAPLVGLGFSSSDLAIIPSGMKTANTTYVDNEVRLWWQTNLALNPGNSGGPIFGNYGTVVGISVAYNKSGNQLTSYIIPIHYAKHYLDLANVKQTKFGNCAFFPECRHELHGVERYAVDEMKDRWGDWRGGGYNRPAYCNDLHTELKGRYPNSRFEFVSDNEQSRNNFGIVSYRYYCSFRRLEQPIYKLARTEFCIP